MNGLKRAGVIGAVAVGLLAGFMLVMQAFAASGTLGISSGSAEPNATGTVAISAEVGDPGLGAWTIDIVFDPAVVSAVDCSAHPAGVCNPDFDPDELGLGDTVRMTGAVASGLDEAAELGTIDFQCGDAEGSTDLTIVVNVFADATIGDPQDIDETVSNGTFDCAVPDDTPEPTDEPPADDTPVIVATGTGGPTSGSGGSIGWVIVALAAVGVAGIAGFGALRTRATRS